MKKFREWLIRKLGGVPVGITSFETEVIPIATSYTYSADAPAIPVNAIIRRCCEDIGTFIYKEELYSAEISRMDTGSTKIKVRVYLSKKRS